MAIDFYRGDTENVQNALIEVGTSSTIILQPSNRKVFYIRNSGSNPVTLNIGAGKAETNKGVVLNIGATYAEADSENFKTFTGTITAISEGGTSTLSIMSR